MKVEAWVLEQAGIVLAQTPGLAALPVVASLKP
jgi:hypothetical protein